MAQGAHKGLVTRALRGPSRARRPRAQGGPQGPMGAHKGMARNVPGGPTSAQRGLHRATRTGANKRPGGPQGPRVAIRAPSIRAWPIRAQGRPSGPRIGAYFTYPSRSTYLKVNVLLPYIVCIYIYLYKAKVQRAEAEAADICIYIYIYTICIFISYMISCHITLYII